MLKIKLLKWLALLGVIGIIVGSLCINISFLMILVMSIMKLTGALVIPWFTGIFSLGAISSGIWMFLFGVFVIGINTLISIPLSLKIDEAEEKERN
jgi:hypothetical protein